MAGLDARLRFSYLLRRVSIHVIIEVLCSRSQREFFLPVMGTHSLSVFTEELPPDAPQVVATRVSCQRRVSSTVRSTFYRLFCDAMFLEEGEEIVIKR